MHIYVQVAIYQETGNLQMRRDNVVVKERAITSRKTIRNAQVNFHRLCSAQMLSIIAAGEHEENAASGPPLEIISSA